MLSLNSYNMGGVCWHQAFFIIALAPFALAGDVSLSLGTDFVTLSCTQPAVYVEAINDGSASASVYLSAISEDFGAMFDSSVLNIPPFAARSTRLRIAAPECFRGVSEVQVNAQACDASGCYSLGRAITVDALPCGYCAPVRCINCDTPLRVEIAHAPLLDSQTSFLSSTLVREASFLPSEYAVRITPKRQCVEVRHGESVKQRVSIENTGAAGSFRLRLSGPEKTALGAQLSKERIVLARNGAEDVFVFAKPEASATAPTGRTWVELQALHGDNVVGSEFACFDVLPFYAASISAPGSTTVSRCGESATIEAAIENTGTADDEYSISTSIGTPSSKRLFVGAGESAPLNITVKTSALMTGTNDIALSAESPNVAGSGTVRVIAEECAAPVAPAYSTTDGVYEVAIPVKNALGKPLYNVSVSAAGLPAGWKVLAQSASLQPGESRELKAWIEPKGDQDAAVNVTVTGDGAVLGSALLNLSPKKDFARATGFFGAAGASLPYVAIVALAVLLVLMLARQQAPVRKPMPVQVAQPAERSAQMEQIKQMILGGAGESGELEDMLE